MQKTGGLVQKRFGLSKMENTKPTRIATRIAGIAPDSRDSLGGKSWRFGRPWML